MKPKVELLIDFEFDFGRCALFNHDPDHKFDQDCMILSVCIFG